MKRYINITLVLLLGLAVFTSCQDLLDVEPEEVLLSDDYLGDSEIDARSALFGVLSQMQDVAGQYVVLGELRADLVNVNSRTEDALRQINNHEVIENNPYADPTTLFAIINNCNFAIEGIDTEAYENLLLDDYASILRIRVWAQMQILIHYGELPYITAPIRTNDDLEKDYPLLSIDQAIDQLISDLQPITDVENVTKYENSLGFNIFSMIPNQEILLGDLNLWKGNYVESATYYKQFLDDNVTGNLYNLSSNAVSVTPSGGSYNISNLSYIDLFQDNIVSNEVVNYAAFSEQFRQPNDSYDVLTTQLKPSELSILKWGQQFIGFEGEPVLSGDTRTLGSIPFIGSGDVAVITKYQEEFFVWNRIAKIYLRYAEAINYAGYPDHALAIVNGIFNNPDVEPVDAPIFGNLEAFLNFDDEYYTFNNSDEPTSGNLGIRGRVSMAPVSVDEELTDTEKIEDVGALILEEAALELAFEGNRWEDLLRFARRSGDASILADAVADKFTNAGDAAGAATIQAKLMNPDNWFLPLTIPSNFSSGN